MFFYCSESCFIGFCAPKLTKLVYLNILNLWFCWILVESQKQSKFTQIPYRNQRVNTSPPSYSLTHFEFFLSIVFSFFRFPCRSQTISQTLSWFQSVPAPVFQHSLWFLFSVLGLSSSVLSLSPPILLFSGLNVCLFDDIACWSA